MIRLSLNHRGTEAQRRESRDENQEEVWLAERAIGDALLTMHGFVDGKGWGSEEEKAAFEKLSRELWDFEALGRIQVYKASLATRKEYIQRVRDWLSSRQTMITDN